MAMPHARFSPSCPTTQTSPATSPRGSYGASYDARSPAVTSRAYRTKPPCKLAHAPLGDASSASYLIASGCPVG